ncbi:MAG: hypothetical protein MJ252_20785 [archaeon]|nr:hypothetical protein [archaeon]
MNPMDDDTYRHLIDIYHDQNTFENSKDQFNEQLLLQLDGMLRQFPIREFIEIKEIGGKRKFKFVLNFELIKVTNPEMFLILVKLLQTFGEQTTIFIKIVLHKIITEKEPNIARQIENERLEMSFKNEGECFVVNDKGKLKVNSYVEFNTRLSKFSSLKRIPTKLRVYCTSCDYEEIKNLVLDGGIKVQKENVDYIHVCRKAKKSEDYNVIKEYLQPMLIRYFFAEIGNEKVLCVINEEKFKSEYLNQNIKLSGIVKAKNEKAKEDNLFIKYIFVTDISFIEDEYSKINLNSNENIFALDNPNSNLNSIDLIQKLTQFSKCQNKLSYFYNMFFPNIEFNNILAFYYLFSLSEGNPDFNLRINMVNLTKNQIPALDLLRNLKLRFSQNLFQIYPNQIGIQNGTNQNQIKKSSLEGEMYVNYPNEHLVLIKPQNKNAPPEIKNLIKNLNSHCSNFHGSTIFNKSNEKSLLCFSENFEDSNTFDILSLVHEMNYSSNDRFNANQIIEDQFEGNRRRKNNDFDQTQINHVEKINDLLQDLPILDTILLNDYFKDVIINQKDEPFKNIGDDNWVVNDDVPVEYDIMPDEYLYFVNKYVYPTIKEKELEDIFFLSMHLKEMYQELKNYPFFELDFVTLSTMTKIAKLSARIELRDTVFRDDIIKAYLITREFLQQNYVYFLFTKKSDTGRMNKTRFVMNKLKQHKRLNGKQITIDEIKAFGSLTDAEFDNVIEKLNSEGVLLKKSDQEYEILD